LIEGILVMVDGKRGAIPVFTNRDEKIIGGFALRRNWVLPVALFFIVSNASSAGLTHNIATPGWWPILKSSPLTRMAKDAAVTLFAYYGVIGYSTVTFTRNKDQKVLSSGIGLILYSIALFSASLLAPLGYIYQLFAIVFAPLAHELMLSVQRYMEVNGTPKYISTEEGIMVLEVAPNSPASEMGIKSGDMLLQVNGKKIDNEQQILTAAKESLTYISFKLRRGLDKLHDVSYSKLSGEKRLGIVFVPRNVPGEEMITKFDESKFKEVLDKKKDKDNEE
jgi:membrane-associated protease RseP (regulator of RpoE activity)